MEPTNTPGSQPDASQLNAADQSGNAGTPAAVSQKEAEALSLAELNQVLGRDFKSKDSALKSIQDTFKFATTRIADVSKTIDESTKSELSRLNGTLESQTKELFYLQNPQYAPHRKLIDGLGKNPGDVVNSDIFKDTFSRLEAHGNNIKLKTVLESNPRLASSRDSLTKAVDLKKSMNGFVTKDVEKLATDAVLDAYGLR